MSQETFEVEAKEIGFFGGVLINAGERFQVTEKQYAELWMKRVGQTLVEAAKPSAPAVVMAPSVEDLRTIALMQGPTPEPKVLTEEEIKAQTLLGPKPGQPVPVVSSSDPGSEIL